jgi:hypothetical protein
MTRFVLCPNPPHVVFPATTIDLRRAFPNVSFRAGFMLSDLSEEDRSEFAIYPVQETPVPEYNRATQKITELQPTADEDGVWTAQYSVENMTEAEVLSYALTSAPPPDFPGFQQAALADADFQAMIAAALPLAPLACLSLAALLTQVAAGQPPDALVLAFAQVIAAAEPTEAHLLQFIATAQEFHLPEPLIDALLRQHLPEPE